MELFAVTGRPIAHSLSPVLFGELFAAEGVDAAYTRLVADSAAEAVRLSRALRLRGLNVTSPFKEEIVPLLDHLDARARVLDAVNTIVFDGEQVRGCNTDPDGVAHLHRAHPMQRVVVFGAGGAARAAVLALVEGGAEVVVINRTEAKARRVAEAFGCRWAPRERACEEVGAADGIVYCLPVDAPVLDGGWIHAGQVVCDARYATSFLQESAAIAGARFVGGLDWLIGHAFVAYERFVGRPVSAAGHGLFDKRPVVRRPRHLALMGMMGAGKSTVGRLIGPLLARPVISLDGEIEKAADASIPEIFTRDGEEHFRQLESEALTRTLAGPPCVLDLGGGAVLREENRRQLSKAALTTWLWASPEVCAARADATHRPLLSEAKPVEVLAGLLQERFGCYARSADLVISVDTRTPDEAAARIAEEVGYLAG